MDEEGRVVRGRREKFECVEKVMRLKDEEQKKEEE